MNASTARRAVPAVLGALACLVAAGSGSARQVTGREIGAGFQYESYSFSEQDDAGLESVTLLTLPFGARASLGSGFDLEVEGAWAEGTVTRPGEAEFTLSGLTDTRIRVGWGSEGGALRFDVTGYAPTGESTHDAAEAGVAGVVAADLLPFRISHWGSAGAVAANLAVARRWGAFGAGVSASYRVSDEFDPVDDLEFTYQPGDEINLRVALDYTVQRSQKLSLSVGVRSFDADAANGANLFQTGDRLESIVTWAFPVSLRAAGALYGGWVHREQGTFLDAVDEVLPPQDLFLAGGLVRLPAWGGFVSPRADVRLFRPEDGSGEGHVIGLGASMELPAGSTVTVLPSVTGRFGSVSTRPGAESSFTGVQAGVTLRLGSGRR